MMLVDGRRRRCIKSTAHPSLHVAWCIAIECGGMIAKQGGPMDK